MVEQWSSGGGGRQLGDLVVPSLILGELLSERFGGTQFVRPITGGNRTSSDHWSVHHCSLPSDHWSVNHCSLPSDHCPVLHYNVCGLWGQLEQLLPQSTGEDQLCQWALHQWLGYTGGCTVYTYSIPVYTVHYILYTVHYTVYCTLYTVYCTRYTVRCTLYTVHWIMGHYLEKPRA